ncbi:MAG: UDP-glucose/GDP-mannose dehydrogenase family protein [Gammaproteobacteria bacterium]|nr:UDP-glucose/GDP-mannose dehydrogenase family protein [Gammaproteobacteria bacterium]
MKVSIYGNSYEAQVLAICLAELGNDICVVEHYSPISRDSFNQPKYSIELEKQRLIAHGKLFNGSIETAASFANIHFFVKIDSQQHIQELIAKIGKINSPSTFVLSSMMSIDEIKAVKSKLNDINCLASIPLFIREDKGSNDLFNPSLFIIGSDNDEAIKRLSTLCRPFINNASKSMVVDFNTAELIKTAINSMLALRVSFMSELANISEQLGVDVELVKQGMASDSRIGGDYLDPGCGFGGNSLSGELAIMRSYLRKYKNESGLIDSIIQINEQQKEVLFRKLWKHYRCDLKGKRVGIWGGAFKPNTSSLDGSPLHNILEALWAQGAKTIVYDPKSADNLEAMYYREHNDELSIVRNSYDALISADALLIITAWNEFYSPDFLKMKALMKRAVIFDGRNIYDPQEVEAFGFQYYAIGRGRT